MNRFDSQKEYIDKLKVELIGPVMGDFKELARRVETIWEDSEREFVIQSLYGFAVETVDPKSTLWFPKPVYSLLPGYEQILIPSLSKLVEAAENLPSAERQSADRAVSRLIRLLTSKNAFQIVEPWFEDKRKFRRNVVNRAIRDAGVPDSYANAIVEWYRQTCSEDAIKIIAENENCCKLLTHTDVENRLALPDNSVSVGEYLVRDRESSYWKMRIISAFLSTGRTVDDQLALENPREFLWAVGRSKSKESLQQVRHLLSKFQNDPEFLWRILKTFQSVGTSSDLLQVREIAKRFIALRNDS